MCYSLFNKHQKIEATVRAKKTEGDPEIFQNCETVSTKKCKVD